MVAVIKPGQLRLPNGTVIKANQYQLTTEASRLLDEVNRLLDDNRRECAAALTEAREQGYQEGLAKVEEEMFERNIKAVENAVAWLGTIEQQIAETVAKALFTFVDEIGKEEISVRMIRKSLADLGAQPKLVISVCAAHLDYIRQGLEEDGDRNLTINAAANLKEGECVIESPLGMIRLKIDKRLDQLLKAVAFSRRKSDTGGPRAAGQMPEHSA
ncbi:MAG: FliH/SctL family protein [Betaproteobacteria bacterium]|nr:FliH/SctL family protein [Betaproteobacteria bacterium]